MSNDAIMAVAAAFWIVVSLVAVAAMFWWLWARTKSPRVVNQASLQDLAAATASGKAAKSKKRKPRTKRANGGLLKPIEYVEFNPENHEHLVALAMLMRKDGDSRIHPTLRFKFDPSLYDNAYAAALSAVAHHVIGPQLQQEAELRLDRVKTKARRARKAAAAPVTPSAKKPAPDWQEAVKGSSTPNAAPVVLYRGGKKAT
jgi:hypothetical protein